METKRQGWKITYVLVGLSVLWFALVLALNGFNEYAVRANIRWSARFSLICFCLAFGASASDAIFKGAMSKWILIHRRFIGVSFAIIHLIHLFFLLLLHFSFDQIFVPQAVFEVTLGGLAYLFVVLMLLTSFKFFARHLSKDSWRKLHLIGGYWILIVFTSSMVGRVVGGKYEYLPFAVMVILVWLIRLWHGNRKSAPSK